MISHRPAAYSAVIARSQRASYWDEGAISGRRARIHLKAFESRMLGWRRVLTGTAASQTIPSDNTPIGRDLSWNCLPRSNRSDAGGRRKLKQDE